MAPGLQTGYCARHRRGVVRWPSSPTRASCTTCLTPLPDEAAVLVEPLACAVHAALHRSPGPSGRAEELTAVVIGAGTLGLCTIAALAHWRDDVTRVIAVAKYSHQKKLAYSPGGDLGGRTGRAAPGRPPGNGVLGHSTVASSPAARLWSSTASAAPPR